MIKKISCFSIALLFITLTSCSTKTEFAPITGEKLKTLTSEISLDKLQKALNNQEHVQPYNTKNYALGKAMFVKISHILPGQNKYSYLNVKFKVIKYMKKGMVAPSSDKKGWILPFDDGNSMLPILKSRPVIKTARGLVLIDGHHTLLTSLYFNAKSFPVKIVKDFSHLPMSQFWKKAAKLKFVYLARNDGESTSMKKLVNDPNRFFVAAIARKLIKDVNGGYISTGIEYPVWIKVGFDIPFVEYYIGAILKKNGFVYDEKYGLNPSQADIEKARQILKKSDGSKDIALSDFRFIPKKTHYQKINYLTRFGVVYKPPTETKKRM